MQQEFFFDLLRHPHGTDLLLRFRSPGPRQNDHRHSGIETADLLQNSEPIHPWHFQIKHNDIGALPAKKLQALPTEQRVEKISNALLIINHENLGHTSP